MSKKRTIDKLANRVGCTRREAADFYDAYLCLLRESIVHNGEFTINGLGTFKVKERAARVGRNPQTGVEINIPSRRALTFRASDAIAKHLNSANPGIMSE